MIQEIFKGRVTASAAAGFAGLLSLFNIGGRIFWASLSDRIGRKATYAVFFALGMLLYASVPHGGRDAAAWRCSSAIFCVILTMYGGGFATIPAYLADLFGVGNVERHSRAAAHGVVDRRHPRSRARQLHPRVPDRPRRRARPTPTRSRCTSSSRFSASG